VTVAAFAVSVLALAVAGGSLWFTYRREHRDEARFHREEALAAKDQRARLSAIYVETETIPGIAVYVLDVTNTGQAAAHHVVVSVEDCWGQRVGRSDIGIPLLSGEKHRFEVRRTVVAWVPPLTPVFEWRNDENEIQTQRSALRFDDS
jgi:hypothetical protein